MHTRIRDTVDGGDFLIRLHSDWKRRTEIVGREVCRLSRLVHSLSRHSNGPVPPDLSRVVNVRLTVEG